MRCAVFGCNSDNQFNAFLKTVRFYRFPAENSVVFSSWKNACGQSDEFNVKNASICSLHFQEIDYGRNLKHELLNNTPKNHRQLKPDAIPTYNLPKKLPASNSVLKKQRQKRREQRTRLYMYKK